MLISLALALLCTISGTLTTYFYDEEANFITRVCTGACIGFALLGLIGFIVASFLGLTATAVLITAFVLVIPAAIVLRDKRLRTLSRRQFAQASQSLQRSLLHPQSISLNAMLFIVAAIILWRVFSRAVIEQPEGISTGLLNNFGDLPFHISVITSFVFGNNFPPEDPTYAGVRFTYPFITDFISAVFVRCGADLRESMFIENIVIAVSLVVLIYRWAWELLRDKIGARLTPLLILLNGGFGWILLWTAPSTDERSTFGIVKQLPPSFTIIPETTWRWGNAISTLLVPQRGMLLGLALAIIVFTQWWLSETDLRTIDLPQPKKKKKAKVQASQIPVAGKIPIPLRRMIAAGVVAGLLPLVHAHTFIVVMGMGGCIALLRQRWREWFVFFFVASVIALPQMWWSTHGSAVDAKKFVEWQFGWDRGQDSVVWFWFKNTGLFIPLLVTAMLWRGKDPLISKRLLLFSLPFTLCFIVPNLIKVAPWVWDNIKVLFYWWVAFAPIVAALLARLWRERRAYRVLAVALFVCITLAGALDVASISLRERTYQVFDRNGVAFAEFIKNNTQSRALIVHAPVHNTPVFLTGRRSLMGYPGHIWTHGLEFAPREAEIRRIYSGAPDAMKLIADHKIEYAVVGPQERTTNSVNQMFFTQFQKVGEVGEYQLYKTTK